MQLLLAYLKPYKWLIVITFLLGAISQTFLMLDAHFLGILIDKFAIRVNEYTSLVDYNLGKSKFFAGVLKYLGLIIGVSMVSRIAKTFQDYFVTVIIQKFGLRLYTDGLKHSMELPFEEFEDQRSGETLSILQNARTHTEQFLITFINIIYTTFISVIFVAVYSYSLHWFIIIFYVVGTFMLSVITLLLTRKIKVIQKAIVSESILLAGSTTESLKNIQLIKSLGLTGQEGDRLSSNVYKTLGLKLKQMVSVRRFTLLQGGVIYFLTMSVYLILLYLIYQNTISAGKLVTLSFYSLFIFAPFRQVGIVMIFYREAQVSLNNYLNLLKKSPESKPINPVNIGSMYQLEFLNVYFKHQANNQYALENVSFKVKAGQTVAFVGPSGSGKTTLVKLLLGLYRPKKGIIYYNEINGKDIDIDCLRTQIGLVTQDTQLFAGTIRENLIFVNPAATDTDLKNVVEKAAFQNVLERTTNGFDALIGEGGIKLSGGEKQRLSIARALLRHPKLLIFDEATSSLDSINEEQVSSTIRTISSKQQSITILIAHRLSTIMHADEINVLEKGRIVEKGTHENLLIEKGLYYAMWRQQIGEK